MSVTALNKADLAISVVTLLTLASDMARICLVDRFASGGKSMFPIDCNETPLATEDIAPYPPEKLLLGLPPSSNGPSLPVRDLLRVCNGLGGAPPQRGLGRLLSKSSLVIIRPPPLTLAPLPPKKASGISDLARRWALFLRGLDLGLPTPRGDISDDCGGAGGAMIDDGNGTPAPETPARGGLLERLGPPPGPGAPAGGGTMGGPPPPFFNG